MHVHLSTAGLDCTVVGFSLFSFTSFLDFRFWVFASMGPERLQPMFWRAVGWALDWHYYYYHYHHYYYYYYHYHVLSTADVLASRGMGDRLAGGRNK